ncbi:major facilitator superfamily domain-containing protein, partial [Pseudoneurospora amorphoporcata]
ICAGLMFSCLDTSIVSTALVSISLDLGDAQDAPWTILGYLLTYMSFAVGFSKLSDIYGRRNLLAIAWVFFSGFSVWCALAGSMKQLIAARALQGIGGS